MLVLHIDNGDVIVYRAGLECMELLVIFSVLVGVDLDTFLTPGHLQLSTGESLTYSFQ